MKLLVAVALLLAPPGAVACSSTLPLKGSVFVESCDPRASDCKDASKQLYEYLQSAVDRPAVLSIEVQTSPWHVYGPDMRIMTIDDLVASIRPLLKSPVKRIELHGSWTGVAPDKDHKSLADQVSTALGGYPVTGMDGFMWVGKGGKLRTTHEAFTMRQGNGPYGVHSGDDVMAALTSGWFAQMEGYFVDKHDADGAMHAAAGWDIFFLCPDHALTSFERAAEMGSAIAAYDAAMIRIERGDGADRKAAVGLLEKAVRLGDGKAREVLGVAWMIVTDSVDSFR